MVSKHIEFPKDWAPEGRSEFVISKFKQREGVLLKNEEFLNGGLIKRGAAVYGYASFPLLQPSFAVFCAREPGTLNHFRREPRV